LELYADDNRIFSEAFCDMKIGVIGLMALVLLRDSEIKRR